MTSFIEFLENEQTPDFASTNFFAGIIGESPSQGAKSPELWNVAFKECGLSGVMHPIDVRSENLKSLVNGLREEEKFIGGAVTMPYKVDIIPFLDDIDPVAESIGAVNCIYRKGQDLVGTNTDGAGALWSLEDKLGPNKKLSGSTVLLIGAGGAGCAVAAYIASALTDDGKLMITSRNEDKSALLADKLKSVCLTKSLQFPPSIGEISDVDIIINCSSVGFETFKEDAAGYFSLKYFSPLGTVNDLIRVTEEENKEEVYWRYSIEVIQDNIAQTLDVLKEMHSPLVFDIVYQPVQTLLLYLSQLTGCDTLNGTGMNLEQAVIAFDRATEAAGLRTSDCTVIRKMMLPLW